ncbi:hypothetical protein C8Q74DRAFT_1039297 [Fomes fomentarius]|nr:hypothetical protein C8Q74DRAFT_1039297 [Fomes fomentarius]
MLRNGDIWGQWSRSSGRTRTTAYPDANIAVERAIKKREIDGLKFDGAWGADPADTKYGSADETKAGNNSWSSVDFRGVFSSHESYHTHFIQLQSCPRARK